MGSNPKKVLFFILLSIGVVLVVLVVGVFLLFRGMKPDINTAGGTILVYEVDQEKAERGFDLKALVHAVQQRLDPSWFPNITVLPMGESRIEITISRSGHDHARAVQDVKDLLSQSGNLEFRILANSHDDREAIEIAQKYFMSAGKDPKIKAELESLAIKGRPPPPPSVAGKPGFTVRLHEYTGDYTYTWVEISRQFRQTLHLDWILDNHEVLDNHAPESLWNRAAQARTSGAAISFSDLFAGGDNLLWSRPVANPARLPPSDQNKEFEFYLLTRDPEKGKEVTGQFLKTVNKTQGASGMPAVAFHCDAEGGERFRQLTSLNLPESSEAPLKRQLAVIVDGQILVAPAINAVVSKDGVIEGNFTEEEVNRLVSILRSGSFPVPVKPLPVGEVAMPPQRLR